MRPPRRAKTAALALASLVALGVPASAMAARAAPSPLQQGLNFYRGKTLIFVVPTAAGAGFDVECRFVAQQMAAYLHANIEISDYPLGNTIPGSNAIAGSVPDGLTFGMLETATDALNASLGLPGLDFNPAHEVFLGGWPNPPQMLATQANSPFTTFQSLESATAANPVTDVGLTNNSTQLEFNLYMKAFNIAHRNITGYSNSSTEVAGFARGDGRLVMLTDATLGPLVVGGVARALALQVPPQKTSPYYRALAATPTFSGLFAKEKKKTPTELKAMNFAEDITNIPQIVLAAPSATKADRYEALRAAVKYSIDTAVVKQDFINRGNPTGFVSPENEKARYLAGLANIARAVEFAGAS